MSARITLLTATSIAITVGAYALSRWIGIRRPSPLTVPVFLATPMVMVVITVTHIGLSGYSRAGGIVTYFLGPATVALAVPFYRRRRVLLDNMVPLCAGLVTGTVVAMVSAVLLARLFGQSHALQAAFSLKTATAPVAIAEAPQVHADPTLVAGLVVVSALLGTMIGPKLLSALRIKGSVARGTALGTISSGQGVAQSLVEGELTGASASISMALAAIVVTLLAPVVVRIFA